MFLSSSQVLQVSATSRDPDVAAEHATAIARAYLKFQAQEAAAVAETYSGLLDNRISGLHESNSDPASKKLKAAILGFQPRRERMAISPVRQLIRGK